MENALGKQPINFIKVRHLILVCLEVMAMVCSYKNSRGKTYYLHQNGRLFFFSGKDADAIEMPEGYEIIENTRTGLPMLKKK